MWGFLVAISTALVALSSPILGAIADEGGLRKRMLVVYCYFGVAATFAMGWVDKGEVLLGALLFICANFGFAGGNVFYNAFLIDISQRKTYGKVSGIAWGLGYIGGGICLVICLMLLRNPEILSFRTGGFGEKDCMFIAAAWWAFFAIPTMLWLKESDTRHPATGIVKLAKKGWNRVSETFKEVRNYKQLLRFLLAYLIFNDGVETVIIMSVIFGAEIVGMDYDELVLFFIMVQATAFIGSLFFGWLADVIGNKRTLIITIFIWIVVAGWAYLLGLWGDIRLEFYLLGLLAGFVLGGTQCVARSMQASFTPPDRSAEFFGFYSVSGRVASIFGPLIYGLATLLTGSVRFGILLLGVFFIAGGAILWTVNEQEGVEASMHR